MSKIIGCIKLQRKLGKQLEHLSFSCSKVESSGFQTEKEMSKSCYTYLQICCEYFLERALL